ncbi:MAG TPA: plasmid mobilization relaxosome protein MobC [Acidisoma sp.]|nr:plasmid mobilization relaxosome protein MobC [Acidisoma sp.]
MDAAAPKAAPWRGRRRVADPKARFVAVRCTDAEHATLTAAAAQAGLSVGAYLRTMALGSPGPRAVRRPSVERADLARLLGELGKIGSNVNQLARAANTSGDMPAVDELAAITADVRVLRDALMKALGRGD